MRDVSGIDPVSYSVPGEWTSWDGDSVASGLVISTPRNIRELVAAMWTFRHQRIRPIGSGWSLTLRSATASGLGVHQPEEVAIDLRQMVQSDVQIGANASAYVRREFSECGRTFFALRCGARLYQINRALWHWGPGAERGYSFPTLGGSHGQTLGGALSTGTHGGDLNYASVNDAVHAMHVVVPGGTEYWIERSPDSGIALLDRVADEYEDWDDDIEIVQDDEVFSASLIACGRLGVIHAVLVEVEDRFYQEQETLWESWHASKGYRSVRQALQHVVATGQWNHELISGPSPYTGVEDPSYLEVHYDPKGPSAYVRRRWRTAEADPHAPRPPSPNPAADSHDLGLGQFMTNLTTEASNNLFAHLHRDNYARRLTDQTLQRQPTFKDVGYLINVGTLATGGSWEVAYDDFERFGPFVESAEFFFNAEDSAYLAFIDAVHDQDWGTICAGYVAIRYTHTRTGALLGTMRFEKTVAVEVTIIKGFKDAQATLEKVISRAEGLGCISHWGQENPHQAPAIDRTFGKDLSRWRRVIPRLLGRYTESMSNGFTREKGLEFGPGIRVSNGRRTVLWLGYDSDRTSTLFHRGFIGADSEAQALRFTHNIGGRHDVAVAVQSDSRVQAKWVIPTSDPSDQRASPGSLVLSRQGRIMAMIQSRPGGVGDFHFYQQKDLPLWVTRPE